MHVLVVFLFLMLTPLSGEAAKRDQICEPYLFQNFLNTPWLVIRSLRLADLSSMLEIYQERLLDKSASGTNEFTLLSKIVRSGFDAQVDWQVLEWGIALKSTGQLIGTVQVYDRRNDGSAQFGYDIHRAFRNQGYATEALKAILNYLFKTLKLKAVRAEVNPTNYASQKVLIKLGFHCLGLFRSDFHRQYGNELMQFIRRDSFW